jgi:hypothetical protein
MPAAPCIQEVFGGSSGGSCRCALHEGIAHPVRRRQQPGGPRWVHGVLRGVEQHLPNPRGAAAAPVVVPESRPEPLRDAGCQDRVQAPLPQPRDIVAGDLGHTRPVQRREQL